MRGVIVSPPPNTPSWRGAELNKNAGATLLLPSITKLRRHTLNSLEDWKTQPTDRHGIPIMRSFRAICAEEAWKLCFKQLSDGSC
jgi:hypothetical protein